MGQDFSKYYNEIKELPPNVCVIHAVRGAFYGINIPKDIVQKMQNIYRQIWIKDVEIKMLCPSLIKFKPHKSMLYNGENAKDSANSKRMFCHFHKIFCELGWSLVSAPTLTYEHSLSSWFYYQEINPFMVAGGTTTSDFCIIALSSMDKLQFIDFPKNLDQLVIDCIKQNWKKGIQEVEFIKETANAWSVKLSGYPWSSNGEQSLDARFLVLSLIRFMIRHNWRLVNSTAMKPDASDTMFFRYFSNSFEMQCPDTMPEYYFMMALIGNNSISILGGNEIITNAITNCCAQHELKGVQSVKMKYNYPTVELVSKVWSRRSEKEMKTRNLLTLLFQDLGTYGWLPIESIDCSRQVTDLSSIAFVRIPPVRMLYFCLCPKGSHRICLINAVDEVLNLVVNVFREYYAVEREKIKRSTYGIAQSIEFEGYPFSGNVKSALLFQLSLAAIISALKNLGWYLVVSADTSNEYITRTRGTTTESTTQSHETVKWSIYGLWFAKVLSD